MAELLAIYAGISLLHTLNLRGTVYSDCLAAVKKITRRWTPGKAFQAAGAALVTAARFLLSSTLTVQWMKGHPERSDSPVSAWTRQQWGIYVADALAKNKTSVHFHTPPYQYYEPTRSHYMTSCPRSPCPIHGNGQIITMNPHEGIFAPC